jgi:DNA-binding NarL/FixJ family response regulator
LQILAEGKSSKEVAAALNISVKTAETHRANIMRRWITTQCRSWCATPFVTTSLKPEHSSVMFLAVPRISLTNVF